MKTNQSVLKVRFAMALLFLFCSQQARLGIYEYKADKAFDLRNFSQAQLFSEKGLRGSYEKSKLLYLQGQSTLTLALKQKDSALFKKASESFEGLIRENPFFARAWIYRGMTAAENQGSWDSIQKDLEQGVALEPGGAWVLNRTGKVYLSYWKELSTGEKTLTLDRIRKSLLLHDYNQPSSYLDESLKLIWNATQDFDLVSSVVPEDLFSYDRLLRFTESQNLWKYRAPIFKKTLILRTDAYETQCRKAEKQLLSGYSKRAFFEFQVASWIDNSRLYAEAGMLASGFPRRLWPFPLEATLKAILEDRDEDWTLLMPRLAPVVESVSNTALTELYEKRMAELSERSEAENSKRETVSKLQGIAADKWWSEPTGNATQITQGSLGMPVEFRPGISRLSIFMKSEPDSDKQFAYVRIRLLDSDHSKILGEEYLDSYLKEKKFEVKTSGGKRWLQVDLRNGKENGPQLELGAVKIEAQS